MTSNNKIVVPEAKAAMEKFKMGSCQRGWRESETRLQRRPDFQRGRLCRWPNG